MTRFHFFSEIDFTEKFMHLLIQDYVHLKDHLLIEIGFRVDKSFFFSFLVFSLSVKETNGDFLGLGRGELLKLAPPKYSRKRKIKKKRKNFLNRNVNFKIYNGKKKYKSKSIIPEGNSLVSMSLSAS